MAPIVFGLDQSRDRDEERLYTIIGESTDSLEVTASDDDVAGHLRRWGLSSFNEIFRTNDVTMQSLPFLEDDMVKELIPSMGHRAQFLSHWKNWKASMYSAPTTLLSPRREPSTSMEKTIEQHEKSEHVHNSCVMCDKQ